MRVLYLHQHFSNPNGSVGIRSYEMARRLIERGHQVIMVCGSYIGAETGLEQPFVKGKRRGTIDGIDIIEFDLAYSNNDGSIKRSLTFMKFAFRSILLVFNEKYDLVFASTTPLTAGVPGIFSRWLKLKTFVFEVRDLWPDLPRAMGVIKNPVLLCAMSFLEWASYRSAHKCIGLAPGIVDGIIARGVVRERVELVPNGCDLSIFASEPTPWRPENVRPKDLMAVFAGTHGVANGLDAVLDAAALLKKRNCTDIKLVLVGQGKLKSKLIERATREGLDNVVFHDPVSKIRLAGLLASADVGLQILSNVPAFYYGTSPNKFFDYIAAGLPVLNNYPGWLADMINEHSCGFTVEPDNPEAFANALEQGVNDRSRLLQMGQASRRLAEQDFDRAKLSNRFVDWLESAGK